MKTIQIRALYFKAVTPAMKSIEVDDEFFDQIPCGIPEAQLAHMLGLRRPEYARRYQVQFEGKIISSSVNKSSKEYPIDSCPW